MWERKISFKVKVKNIDKMSTRDHVDDKNVLELANTLLLSKVVDAHAQSPSFHGQRRANNEMLRFECSTLALFVTLYKVILGLEC